MSIGIIGGAMAGGGSAIEKAGVMLGDYASKSALQKEMAEIMKMRDERLSELRKGEMRYEADLRAEPGRLAQEEIEGKLSKPAYDEGADSVRPHSLAERAKIEEDALRRRGLVGEAMRAREGEQRRQEHIDNRADRETAGRRDDARLEEQKRHNQAIERIQQAAEGRLAAGAKIDADIKAIALANAQRVKALQTEFATASAERKKAINEEIQLLTGKDNDNYLPVPIKDEAGAITGYQIFDKKRGSWVEGAQPKPGSQGGKDGERPPLLSFFRGNNKDKPAPSSSAPASGGASTPAAAPAARSDGGRQRDMEMEAKDSQLKALAVSLGSKDPNESTRAWIAYTNRLKELRAGP